MLKRDAWIPIWSTFKAGDDVMIVTDEDDYWWGKFDPTTKCCRVDGHEWPWSKIVLICHAGFPVRFTKTGICPEWFDNNRGKMVARIERIISDKDFAEKQRLCDLRKAADTREEKRLDREHMKEWGRPRTHSYGCGDPWWIEDVVTIGVDIGMGEEREHLHLTDRYGQVGLLYDLPGIIEVC